MRELKYMENVPCLNRSWEKKAARRITKSQITFRVNQKLKLEVTENTHSWKFTEVLEKAVDFLIGHKIEDVNQVHMHLKGQNNF